MCIDQTMQNMKGLVKMKKSKLITAVCICALSLSACSKQNVTDAADISDTSVSSEQTTDIISEESNTDNTEPAETESAAETASYEELQKIIDEAVPPEINITENSTTEEIMEAGKNAAFYFGEKVDRFFEYGVDYNWKIDYDDDTEIPYWKILGFYIDKATDYYVPMDGGEIKQFLIDYIGLTEKGYEELREISPSHYKDVDGDIYLASGDGGQAGTLGSYITDYVINDDGSVTYNCLLKAEADSGYEDEIFSFTIVGTDGVWRLDGCTSCEYFSHGFVGFESDLEALLNRPDIPYDEVMNLLNCRNYILNVIYTDTLPFDTASEKITIDGMDYYPVSAAKYDQWDEWEEYVKSVYTDEAAEFYLNDKKIINIDGKTYTNDGGRGDPLSSDFTYEIVSGDSENAVLIITNTDNFSDEPVETEITLKLTPNGWRIDTF